MSPATGSLRLLHQRATSAAACCCGLVVAAALAAEPSTPEPDYADDLPRIPQVAAADALATMEVADGFALCWQAP
jgi:hypothetical protein